MPQTGGPSRPSPHQRIHGPVRAVDPERCLADAPTVAKGLLGGVLVRRLAPTVEIWARVVEVEAYEPTDPASHSHRGRTPRNGAMFGPPGVAYVYRSYGRHWCLNVVTGPSGHGAAVLLRAAAVLRGADPVAHRRPTAQRGVDLLRGPGCLSAGLAVDASLEGTSLLDTATTLWVGTDGWAPGEAAIASGPRVGVTRAADVAWRFWIAGAPEVSRYRRSPRG